MKLRLLPSNRCYARYAWYLSRYLKYSYSSIKSWNQLFLICQTKKTNLEIQKLSQQLPIWEICAMVFEISARAKFLPLMSLLRCLLRICTTDAASATDNSIHRVHYMVGSHAKNATLTNHMDECNSIRNQYWYIPNVRSSLHHHATRMHVESFE